jgi:hypothetical protein
MKYSLDNVGAMQLDEYVVKIAALYSASDRNRSLWDVWAHTLHHAAGIAERLRKKAPAGAIFEQIADFSLWLFTAVNKLEGRIGDAKDRDEDSPEAIIRIRSTCSDLVWNRYPRICPFCFFRRSKVGNGMHFELLGPCDCPSQTTDAPQEKSEKRAAQEALHRFGEQTRSGKPKSIDGWQDMFGAVFRVPLSNISLPEVMLHLMEEIGEASDAMVRMYSYKQDNFVAGEPNHRQRRLESQLADVFSWLFGLVEALDTVREQLPQYESWRAGANDGTDSIRLSEIIWRRYGSDQLKSFYCPFCKGTACSCPLIFVPATRSTGELQALVETDKSSLGN